jgi:Caspase domain
LPNHYDFALVVGIDDYTSFTPLHGSVNDAQHFHDWLTSPSGADVPEENISLHLSSGQAGEPRRDQVENKILPFIEKYLNDGDPIGRRIYLFFAGHGIDMGSLEDCGLVMADASPVASDRAIPGRRLATAFKHSHAFSEVILFMDCCREVQIPNPPTGELPILTALPKVEHSTSRMLHGLATQWQQVAGERLLPNPEFSAEQGESVQGIFTYALLDGLKRAAGTDGHITGGQLRNYVGQYMTALGDGGQKPVIDFAPEDIVICSPGPGTTRLCITLNAPHQDFDVRDPDAYYAPVATPKTQVAGTTTWTLPVRPGLYLLGAPAGRQPDHYDVQKKITVVGRELVVEL